MAGRLGTADQLSKSGRGLSLSDEMSSRYDLGRLSTSQARLSARNAVAASGGIGSQRCSFGLRTAVCGVARGKLQAGPDPACGLDAAKRRDRAAVSEVEVVNDRSRRSHVAFAGRHPAVLVTLLGNNLRLVDGQPSANSITQRLEEHRRVVGEPLGTISVLPSASILQGLRQVPVIKGGHGRDAPGEQPFDQPVIELEAPPVDGPAAIRKHAGQAMENR